MTFSRYVGANTPPGLRMLIDFQDIHRRYLIPCNTAGGWGYEPVNPGNTNAGKMLCHHQVFSNAALGFGLYIRNEYQKGVPTKAHAGVKLLFSTKGGDGFLLHNDPARISITLDINAVIPLYRWLMGVSPSLVVESPQRGGGDFRSLSGYWADRQFALMLRGSLSTSSGERRSIDVGLSDGDAFHLQMTCLGLGKLLYPSISDEAVGKHMLADRAAASTQRQSAPGEQFHAEHTDERPEPAARPLRDPEQCKKAVYGVGMRKWPIKHLPTIEFIQSQQVEIMDRLIQAGNRGDFTEWDLLHQRISAAKTLNR